MNKVPSPLEFSTREELRSRLGKKWRLYGDDVLPAWVADMDIKPAAFVHAAILEALRLGDIGYPPVSEQSGVPEAFADWCKRRWGWTVDPQAVHLVPEVVAGIDNCIETLTARGDAIMVQTPIYPPFMSSVKTLGRRLVENEMGRDGVDLDRMRDQMRAENVRLVLLCNPHNPSGRVLVRDELMAIAAMAEEHDVIVISDEVHADLVYPSSGRRHIPFASLGAAVAARTVTLNSASKAFNVAGLRLAVCAVENPRLREKIMSLPVHRRSAFSTLGVYATLAAWTAEGEQWLDALVRHLEGVRDRVAECMQEALPSVRFTPPMASYLAWFDCAPLGLNVSPFEFFLEHAKVGLSRGEDFGPPGASHVRMNFGTSHDIAEEIVGRMGAAVRAHLRK